MIKTYLCGMKDNILKSKSLNFAIRIVNLYKYLSQEKREMVISKQLLRSGTSIGANISESEYAQSKADFITKLHISLKEAGESEYWLELLKKTDYLSETQYQSLIEDCREILKLLASSLKTLKSTH